MLTDSSAGLIAGVLSAHWPWGEMFWKPDLPGLGVVSMLSQQHWHIDKYLHTNPWHAFQMCHYSSICTLFFGVGAAAMSELLCLHFICACIKGKPSELPGTAAT